jgi:hypothetical protein
MCLTNRDSQSTRSRIGSQRVAWRDDLPVVPLLKIDQEQHHEHEQEGRGDFRRLAVERP